MGRIGIWQVVLILVIVLVIFGGSKLAGVGKALGKSVKDFKEEVKSDDSKDKAADEAVATIESSQSNAEGKDSSAKE